MLERHVCRGDDRRILARAADELEAPARSFCERMIVAHESRNAGTRNFASHETAAKCELCENSKFVPSVDPLDVVRRIDFGETQTLCGFECAAVRRALKHFGEDEVRRPVEDAADLENLFARERFRDRAHDGNRAADGRFVRDRYAVARREGAQLRTARREEIFIGRDDVLARLERGNHELRRDARAADTLDHDVDRRIEREGASVFREEAARNFLRPRLIERANCDTGEPVIDTAASGDRRRFIDEESRDTASDRTAP